MMGRVCLTLSVGVSALCVAAAAHACVFGSAARQTADYTVGYESASALWSATAQPNATVLGRVPALRIARMQLTADAATRIARRPGIRFVARMTRRIDESEPALQPAVGKSSAWEWQYGAAHEDDVPDRVLRAASSITIAVIDTGADVTAPDIAAKSPTVFSTRTGTDDVRDTVGHGTFVAALAAGSVTNGDGIAGFGGDAKLMIVKAGAGDGSITDADEATAIAYAVDHGARVINLSFGGTSTTATEESALDYAANHGALVVAAAGNHYLTGNEPVYPAALLQPLGSKGFAGTGLAVGASTATGSRAAFSNTGTYVSLVAPGDTVFSAVSSSSPASAFPRVPLPGSLRGLYGYGSGTSFAAPQVAGAAALVMAANPLLSISEVAQVLKDSASGDGSWTPDLGYGVLDVADAVALASRTVAEPAQAALKLRVRTAKRHVTLTATLSSVIPGTSTGARSVVFERHVKSWRKVGTAATDANGKAALTLPRAGTPLVLRARWAGSADLAPTSSKPVRVKRPVRQ